MSEEKSINIYIHEYKCPYNLLMAIGLILYPVLVSFFSSETHFEMIVSLFVQYEIQNGANNLREYLNNNNGIVY